MAFVRVTVNARRTGYDTSIWAVSTAGGEETHRLTTGTRDSQPRWSPDGKYLAFVHQTVNPRLTSEAAKVLKAFYMSLRDKYGDDDSIPITMRQLESLIRLSQARARLERREEVTVQDAEDIVDLMKESLYEVLADDMGYVDFQRNTGNSRSKQTKQFIAALTREAERRSSALFSIRVGAVGCVDDRP